MARYRPNGKNSVTVDPTKDDGSSVSESDDEYRHLRTRLKIEQTSSSTPSARPAGPTVVEQAIDGFDEDGLRVPTAVASEVQGAVVVSHKYCNVLYCMYFTALYCTVLLQYCTVLH